MIFYFSADGEPIKVTPSRVFQGSNKASRIFFVSPVPQTNVVNVAFTLPNGEFTTKRLMTNLSDLGLVDGENKVVDQNGTIYSVWEYSLPLAITQYAGQVSVQFFVTAPADNDGDNEITSTASGYFVIEKGSGYVQPEIADNTYQEILNALAVINIDILELNDKVSQLEPPIIDSELSTTSENPVQNKVITGALNKKQNSLSEQQLLAVNSGITSEKVAKLNGIADEATNVEVSSENGKIIINGVTEIVYDDTNLRKVAEGKTNSYVLSYNDNFDSTPPVSSAKWFLADGTEITDQIGTEPYINDNCINSWFNNIQSAIPFSTTEFNKFIIFRTSNDTASGYNFLVMKLDNTTIKRGDVIYVIENDVPDRWKGEKMPLYYALETRSLPADSQLSTISENAVQNKVVTAALNDRYTKSNVVLAPYASNGFTDIRIGENASRVINSVAIGDADVDKFFVYTATRKTGEQNTTDTILLASNSPTPNAVPMYSSDTANLKTNRPVDFKDAVNLEHLLNPYGDSNQYIAPIVWYKHKVYIEMYFNSESLGSQSIVIVGNYLSRDQTRYDAVLDASLFEFKTNADTGLQSFEVPDVVAFSNGYVAVQDAFANIFGNDFNIENVFVGSYDPTTNTLGIVGNIVEYFIGGVNGVSQESLQTSYTMFFRNNSWFKNERTNVYDTNGNITGFTDVPKPAYVSTNLYSNAISDGFIRRITDYIKTFVR